MLDRKDYYDEAEAVVSWIDRYFSSLENMPVKSQVKPGDILEKLPKAMPEEGENISLIMSDLDRIILPGITHWQHPRFHAYFPANSSVESLLAEQITSAIGAQCMIWETSPAAAELEQRMMEWLRDAMGFPPGWEGVIQDTASTATLAAILTAREKATGFTSNEKGVPPGLRIYCSEETHSSIDKAVAIAGIGRQNLVKIAVNEDLSMSPHALKKVITKDLEDGLKPFCVVATIGTTGTLAVDPVEEIGSICEEFDLWLHVDAAYAGTALLLPEYRWMLPSTKHIDSFVFNPHKWMFTNFDCSVYFVKDRESLIRTFEILPEYLRTGSRGKVNDYRDWGIPLGRRFRSLKLWFVLRSYGLQGIQQKLRKHIKLNEYFRSQLLDIGHFILSYPSRLNFTSFQLKPDNVRLEEVELNDLNKRFLDLANVSGMCYITHTVVKQHFILRMVIGQTYVEKEHVDLVLKLFREIAGILVRETQT